MGALRSSEILPTFHGMRNHATITAILTAESLFPPHCCQKPFEYTAIKADHRPLLMKACFRHAAVRRQSNTPPPEPIFRKSSLPMRACPHRAAARRHSNALPLKLIRQNSVPMKAGAHFFFVSSPPGEAHIDESDRDKAGFEHGRPRCYSVGAGPLVIILARISVSVSSW